MPTHDEQLSPGPNLIIDEINGERTLFVTPDIPDDAPEIIREGFARPVIAVLDGQCPCGARRVMPNRESRRRSAQLGQVVITAKVEHETDCPAGETVLLDAIRAWRQ